MEPNESQDSSASMTSEDNINEHVGVIQSGLDVENSEVATSYSHMFPSSTDDDDASQDEQMMSNNSANENAKINRSDSSGDDQAGITNQSDSSSNYMNSRQTSLQENTEYYEHSNSDTDVEIQRETHQFNIQREAQNSELNGESNGIHIQGEVQIQSEAPIPAGVQIHEAASVQHDQIQSESQLQTDAQIEAEAQVQAEAQIQAEAQMRAEAQLQTEAQMQVDTVLTTMSGINLSQPSQTYTVSAGGNMKLVAFEAQQEETVHNQMPCMICGDRGSGYHYSVYSCEGCKGFFKRSVQKGLLYNCKDQGNCVINKFTRNSCQHCRFQKCMEMGMKREAVREDRSPGGKHRHKRQRLDEITAAMFGNDVPQGQLEVDDKLISGLVNAKPDLVPRVEGNLGLRNMGINELMQYGYAELKYIIDWAKKVPGFHELCIEDQMALLKSSFMELNVLRLSFRSMDTENSIRFAEGLLVPVELAQGMGWGKDLVSATVEFSKRLRDLNIDATEFCILNGIVLTYPDASGVTEKAKVTVLQTKFLDSLRRYVSHQYPLEKRRYGKMLLRLPSLRTVSAKAAERFLSLTLDGTIQLNDLVLEMIN